MKFMQRLNIRTRLYTLIFFMCGFFLLNGAFIFHDAHTLREKERETAKLIALARSGQQNFALYVLDWKNSFVRQTEP